jgi:hypothetical protein
MPPTNEEVVYGQGWGGSPVQDLTVPSGVVCLVKRPDPMIFVEAGALDEIDVLTTFVQEKHVTRVQKGKRVKVVEETPANDAELMKLMSDPDTRSKLRDLMDRVTCAIVIKPEVFPNVNLEDRVGGRVYVDTIDFVDKAFILKYAVGDPKALERFRQQNQQSD